MLPTGIRDSWSNSTVNAERVPRTESCEDQNISHAANVARFLLSANESSRLALVTLDEEYTYEDLIVSSTELCRELIASGGRKGDRVILIAENSFFWIVAYLATLRAGMICVPLPPTIAVADLEHILETTQPKYGFVRGRTAGDHERMLRDVHCVVKTTIPGGASAVISRSDPWQQLENDVPATTIDDVAALMFTSGSASQPRGVVVTHGNIIANTTSIIRCLRLTCDDRIMTVLPFHYCFGTSLLHTHLRVGGCLVMDNRFPFPEKVLQRMRETECTGFAGVPSHFQILLRRSSLGKMRFPHLRCVQQAGGHLAPVFINRLREALPGADIVVMYGQTEATARLSYLPPAMLMSKLGSIGKAIPGVTLKVLSPLGTEVRPGEVGEIVAEGDNITRGYWRQSEETAACFRNGRLYTGDLATVDEDGFIYISGRSKDFVKCGGKRIACRQIEEKLLEFDSLVDVAVIGVPDEILGEAIKAFIVPTAQSINGLQSRVRAFCERSFPPQLVPKEIVVLDELPKNSAGKVMKSQLARA